MALLSTRTAKWRRIGKEKKKKSGGMWRGKGTCQCFQPWRRFLSDLCSSNTPLKLISELPSCMTRHFSSCCLCTRTQTEFVWVFLKWRLIFPQPSGFPEYRHHWFPKWDVMRAHLLAGVPWAGDLSMGLGPFAPQRHSSAAISVPPMGRHTAGMCPD